MRKAYRAIGFMLLVTSGCTGTHPVGYLNVRNESSQPVTVEARPTGGLFLGLFGDHGFREFVPPWVSGDCPTATQGVDSRPVTVTLSGPQMQSATITAFQGEALDVYIFIDSKGRVSTAEGQGPETQTPCTSYQFEPER